MNGERVIGAGETLLLTQGAYDDYSVVAIGRALQPIDIDAAMAAYLSERPKQSQDWHFDARGFAAWLREAGLIEKLLPYREWHLGSYGIPEFQVERITT